MTTPPRPGMVGINVTDMNDQQIAQMEAAGHVDGVEIGGVLFPNGFAQDSGAHPTTQVKDTKHNRELFKRYGAKAFLKDGSINYSTLADKDVIMEMRRYPGISGIGKFARPNCWKVMRQLSKTRIPRLIDKLGGTKCQKKTQNELEKHITNFVKFGTPEAVNREKRHQERVRKERKAERAAKLASRPAPKPKALAAAVESGDIVV